MTDLEQAEAALAARDDLEAYAGNARALFCLQMEFGIEDLASTAADAVVDGPDDKNVDVVFIDDATGRAVIAQDYERAGNGTDDAAPANKAAGLAQGVQWLLGQPVAEIPERLRSAAELLRTGVEDGSVGAIDLWYVHNCDESENVRKELEAARDTLDAVVSSKFPDSQVECSFREIGAPTFAEMYRATQVVVEVTDDFTLEVEGIFEEEGDQWKAVCASLPGEWLVDRFNEYGESLFSANIRGYLGSRRSDRNINNGIKETAGSAPGDFWVFNNGVTALVNDFSLVPSGDNETAVRLTVSGLAIVNGAQTTGSLASSGADLADVSVMARFVKCQNLDVVRQIIRFNNRQNKVEAVDFRSNDTIQTRLRREFAEFGNLNYSGGRRGGVDDVIRRPGDSEIPASTASQALAAFHGDPNLAYNRKSEIWESDAQYGRYFREELTAEHMFFTFSLLRAVERAKRELRATPEPERTEVQRRQLDFLSRRGAIYLTVTAVAAGMESIIGRNIASRFEVRFEDVTDLETATEIWGPVVRIALSLSNSLVAGTEQGLKNSEHVQQVVADFQGQLEAIKEPSAETFEAFAKHLHG